MKIYKLSQRMFNIDGMEQIVLESFKRHYINFIKSNNREELQKQIDSGVIFNIGYIKIGDMIDKISQEHGLSPRENFPKMVYFYIISKNNKDYGKYNAIFKMSKIDLKNNIHKKPVLNMGKIIENIDEVVFDEGFINTIYHEWQHLFNKLYTPEKNLHDDSENSEENNKPKKKKRRPPRSPEYKFMGEEYYRAKIEIQAYCSNIAKSAFEGWKVFLHNATKNWSPNKLLAMIPKMMEIQNKKGPSQIFLYPVLDQFDKSRKNILTNNPDLKKQYYYYSFKNFENLYDRFLKELENKIRSQNIQEK